MVQVPPVLTTERLILRPYQPGDLDAMAAMFDDPDVTAMTYLGRRTRAQTEAVLADYTGFMAANGHGMYAILDRKTDDYLGEAGVFMSPLDRLALRYALVKSAWGKGYAVEASQAVLADCFGRLGLDALMAGVKPENAASRRVLERLGFVLSEELTEKSPFLVLIRQR
jgi:[ribosomal protein S5]-alanine N-acetyltransferase